MTATGMKTHSRPASHLASLAAAFVAVSLGTVCHAQDAERTVDLHAYGQVSEVRNLSAPGGGFELDYNVAALGVWRIRPDVRAWLQLARYRELNETRVEWAFLDWDVSASTTLRLGQSRVPMGLVNEARDVQTLRNSLTKPFLYDGEHGLVDEALRGVIAEHRRESVEHGGLVVEGYATGATIRDESSAIPARLLGGRVQWTPPSSSWTLSASAYAGRQAPEDADESGWSSRHALVVSAKVRAMGWDLTGEIGTGRSGEGTIRVGYLQGDRDLSGQHTLFMRAESSRRQPADEGPEWRDRLSAGLAWKPSPHWGCRIELGANRASPTAPTPPATTPRTRWNLSLIHI